jgi:tetratricopeptide (TPR) repeat protein
MNNSQRAVIRLLIFFLLPGTGGLGWFRVAVLQQLLLQCQASYRWQSASKKFQDGDYEDSLRDFYRCLWLDPGATEAEVHADIVRFYLTTNSEQVIPSYAILGLDQMDSVIYNNRGNVRLSQGDGQGAVVDYTEAIQLQSDQAATYYNRGNASLSLGDRSAAIADLQTAAQLWQEQEMVDWYEAVLAELNSLTNENDNL